MLTRHIVGIDPGLQGAIAIYNTYDKKIDFLGKTPTNYRKGLYLYQEIIKIFTDHIDPLDSYVIIEQQHCMPGEGLKRTFKTGFGFGMYIGILETLGLSYDIVLAMRWQNKVLFDYPKTIPIKERSIAHAKQYFKLDHLFRTEKSYTDHDGLADALNMVIYGKKKIEKPEEVDDNELHIHKLNPVKVCITCGEYVV